MEPVAGIEGNYGSLVVCKQLCRITNNVSEKEFTQLMPTAKLNRLKWPLLYQHLKQIILDKMTTEWNTMWIEENMQEKIFALEKQKEKYMDIPAHKWRPKLGDVKQQLMAHDLKVLQNEKDYLLQEINLIEEKVEQLKKNITPKRKYLHAFQLDLQKYKNRNEDLLNIIGIELENHASTVSFKYTEDEQ